MVSSKSMIESKTHVGVTNETVLGYLDAAELLHVSSDLTNDATLALERHLLPSHGQ